MSPLVYLYFVAIASLSASSYQCPANDDCSIDCTGVVDTSDPTPTNCTDLTINARASSSITVSCADNTYCDSLTIFAPQANVNINCVGGENVCNNIQVYTNSSTSDIVCGTTVTDGSMACTNATIYGVQGVGTTDTTTFTCNENTQCDEVTISNAETDTTTIKVANKGTMNELNISAPYAHTMTFDEAGGNMYNNSYIDNRGAKIQTRINTATWLNSEFYFGGLAYNNYNNKQFYGNELHFFEGYEVIILFSGAAHEKIHSNVFYTEDNPIDIRVEENIRFVSNDIFANNSANIHVYMAGINASIASNNIYAQNAKKVNFVVEDKRDVLSDNNFRFDNAVNVTFSILGQFFSNNVTGQSITRFSLYCLEYGAMCGSDNVNNTNKYVLTNAQTVLLQAGDGSEKKGGIINGGDFDVSAVTNLKIFSYYGFIRNINVNAQTAGDINVTMYSGQLFNSTINASESNSLAVWCKSRNYWDEMNDTDCTELTLRVPPPSANRRSLLATTDYKASLLCDGIGCQSLVLDTVNGAQDINVTGKNCNCKGVDVTSGVQCIDEWEIYCGDGNGEPSVVSNITKCDGECCDNVMDSIVDASFQDLDECKKKDDDTKMKVLLIVLIIVGALLCCIAAFWMYKCYSDKNKRTERNESFLALQNQPDEVEA